MNDTESNMTMESNDREMMQTVLDCEDGMGYSSNLSFKEQVGGGVYGLDVIPQNKIENDDGDKDEDDEENEENDERYSFEQLISRCYKMLQGHDLNRDRRINMDLPNVEQSGFGAGIRSIYRNFSGMVHRLNRPQLDIENFFKQEINPDISVNANGEMIIKGRYSTNQIQIILRKYIDTYIKCKDSGCASLKTSIIKKNNITFIACQTCGSEIALRK